MPELDPIRAPKSRRWFATVIVGVFVVLGVFVGASWWVGGPYWRLGVTALVSGAVGAVVAAAFMRGKKR